MILLILIIIFIFFYVTNNPFFTERSVTQILYIEFRILKILFIFLCVRILNIARVRCSTFLVGNRLAVGRWADGRASHFVWGESKELCVLLAQDFRHPSVESPPPSYYLLTLVVRTRSKLGLVRFSWCTDRLMSNNCGYVMYAGAGTKNIRLSQQTTLPIYFVMP